MPKLVYTPQALRDLDEIRRYIARRSGLQSAGITFTKKIRTKCKELASAAGMIGIARPELREDVRSHPYGNYVILLRYHQEDLEIVSIIEGHRDIEQMFKD
jgi:toxin ParE1/3/4